MNAITIEVKDCAAGLIGRQPYALPMASTASRKSATAYERKIAQITAMQMVAGRSFSL
jgi:hypothetical protein